MFNQDKLNVSSFGDYILRYIDDMAIGAGSGAQASVVHLLSGTSPSKQVWNDERDLKGIIDPRGF